MKRVLHRVRRLAPAGFATMVCGETGTGKELIASLLHAWSPRSQHPFVRFNCGAIPRDLVESELFGHVRGSFTGASSSRKGYFGLAQGGTLVLDEIEALPLEAQPKLLRALEEGEMQVVGGGAPQRVNLRVVACTNADLENEVASGRFRQDLFFRLAIVRIDIPPLRERPEDILPLFDHFLSQVRAGDGPPLQAAVDLRQRLPTLPWPGNVRQLRNAVAAMAALTEDGILDLALLSSVLAPQKRPAAPAAPAQNQHRGWLKAQVASFERTLVEQALRDCHYNCSKTARQLGLCRTTLIDLIRRHGIVVGDLSSSPP